MVLLFHIRVPLFILPISWMFYFPPYPIDLRKNDHYANRIQLDGTNAVFGGSLVAATAEADEPKLPGDSMQRSLWWSWRAPGDGILVIRNQITNAIPVVGVFQRTGMNQLALMGYSGTQFGNDYYRYWGGRTDYQLDVKANIDYDILVDRYPEMDATVDVSLNLQWLPASVNDHFENPQWLEGNDLSLMVSNITATYSTNQTAFIGTNIAKCLWYAWKTTNSGILQLSTNAPVRYVEPSHDTIGGAGCITVTPSIGQEMPPLVDLNPLPPFVPVWGLFEYTSNATRYMGAAPVTYWTNVAAHTEYRIGLQGKDGSYGTTVLNLFFTAPPENDDFENRIILPSSALNVVGRTFAATADPYQPSYAYGDRTTDRSVWWEWHAPKSGLWVLYPGAGVTENVFAIYRGGQIQALTEVGHSFTSTPIVFEAGTGDVFEFGVMALKGWGSNIGFTLTEEVPPGIRLSSNSFSGPVLDGLNLEIAASGALYFVIESSTNLSLWTPFSTNRTSYPTIFHCDIGTNTPSQFFRTRLLK